LDDPHGLIPPGDRPGVDICGKPDPDELSIDVGDARGHFNRNLQRNGAMTVGQRAMQQEISTVTCASAAEIPLQSRRSTLGYERKKLVHHGIARAYA
jgi:hypothetical protein